jgi:hypothetical protein
MISEDCNIVAFVNAVKGKQYPEIIELADHEATLAERCRYSRRKGLWEESDCARRYSHQLKDLIFYLRNSIRPANTQPEHIKLYDQLLDAKQHKMFQIEFRSLGHSVYYLPFNRSSS